ncbi:hypothetical protein F5144DRAFT_351280 [Chaetomium tenue]|uniref:Uncharacterized protein n=1 Tax=Chaetomium tenue TaxID=1854479 RepID=A0ACB7NZG7_9PEZI|nr:hypothetical protein F5144DRAFT_351280 [Chaetomium globosum]
MRADFAGHDAFKSLRRFPWGSGRDGQGTAPTSRPPSSQPFHELFLQHCSKSYRACSKWVSVSHVVPSSVFVQCEMNTVSGFHPPCQIPCYPNTLRYHLLMHPAQTRGVLLPVSRPRLVVAAHTFKPLQGIHFWTQLPANVGPHEWGRDFDRRVPGWIAWSAAPLRRGGETS